MFEKGQSIDDVAAALGKARSTTVQYLVEYIKTHKPPTIAAWVDDAMYRRVADAASKVGTERLKPISELLGGEMPYDTIRLVARHLEVRE